MEIISIVINGEGIPNHFNDDTDWIIWIWCYILIDADSLRIQTEKPWRIYTSIYVCLFYIK